MKQKLIAITLTICLITAGSLYANANPRSNAGECQQNLSDLEDRGNQWSGKHRHERDEMMAVLLDLTEDQQEQIKTIREAERTFSEGLREKMREYKEQMREISNGGTFDEAAIRAIAREKADNQVEMSVSKARMHSQINAIMTTEQQELVEKFRSARKGKRGKNHRGSMWAL